VPLKAKGLKMAEGPSKNELQHSARTPAPLRSEQAQLKGLHLKEVYEYDLMTQAGKTYSIKIK